MHQLVIVQRGQLRVGPQQPLLNLACAQGGRVGGSTSVRPNTAPTPTSQGPGGRGAHLHLRLLRATQQLWSARTLHDGAAGAAQVHARRRSLLGRRGGRAHDAGHKAQGRS